MKTNVFIDILSLLKSMLTNSDGLMTSFIPYTTRDSRITSRTSGCGLTHRPYLLTLSCKPNEPISITGTVSMRRRFRHPENLPPLSRRLPIKNLSPHLQNPVSPPNPHLHQPPTRWHRPPHPRLEPQPRPPTPIKICPQFLGWMANSFLKRRNEGRS